MPTKYPCNICNNPVAKNHKAIQCDKCQLWVHIKCNKINVQTYNLLIEDEVPGTVYLVKKIYILSLASTTLNFIKQYKVKK